MKTIYHFFRLIRTINLLVIGLTMVVIETFLDKNFITSIDVTFILLIVSTLLIAAAGNIINDYFDVRADRINKPNRLIISKHIKKRWAMVLHWSFNSLGMILALYVGYVLQNIWVPLVSFLSINLLWFYSAYYKRKPLVGNLIVAILIGIIPIHVLLFNLPIHNYILTDNSNVIYARYYIDVIILVSALAFCLNLMREIVKDILDIRGDLRLGAETFPIKYGIKKTKLIVVAIFILSSFILSLYLYKIITWREIFENSRYINPQKIELSSLSRVFDLYFFGLLLTSAILTFSAFIMTLTVDKIKGYKIASTIFKLAMLFGLLTPLFL